MPSRRNVPPSRRSRFQGLFRNFRRYVASVLALRRLLNLVVQEYTLRAKALPLIMENATALQKWVQEYQVARKEVELANVKLCVFFVDLACIADGVRQCPDDHKTARAVAVPQAAEHADCEGDDEVVRGLDGED